MAVPRIKEIGDGQHFAANSFEVDISGSAPFRGLERTKRSRSRSLAGS